MRGRLLLLLRLRPAAAQMLLKLLLLQLRWPPHTSRRHLKQQAFYRHSKHQRSCLQLHCHMAVRPQLWLKLRLLCPLRLLRIAAPALQVK